MRIGQNPAKYLNEVAKPQRITVAVLNYIPFQSGFYAEMKDVLTACLDHIHANTDRHPNRDVDTYIYTDTNPFPVPYWKDDSDAHANSHDHPIPDAHPDPDADTACDLCTDDDADADPNQGAPNRHLAIDGRLRRLLAGIA